MNYYAALLVCFVVGFLVTELVRRRLFRRTVVVMVKNNDGTFTAVKINAGKDAELDRVVKEIRAKKKVAS